MKTLWVLALCAASAAAALAHYAIDVVGDFALAHDTYDDVAHSSRELLSGIALVLAVLLAARGLRICCEIAASNRGRLPLGRAPLPEIAAFVLATVAVTACLVPAMECLDGRLAGAPVTNLADAFGGSVALGLCTTIACAGLLGLALYAFARWLVSHRDAIVAIIETLLCRRLGDPAPHAQNLWRHTLAPRRRRAPHALRLCKRGPPHRGRTSHLFHTSTEGESREFRLESRVANAFGARHDAWFRCAGLRAAHECAAR